MNKLGAKGGFLDALFIAIIIATVIMLVAVAVYFITLGIESVSVNRAIEAYNAIEGGVY